MPFDWLQPHRVKRPQNRKAMYLRELQERAALLRRLGYSRGHARSRLAANVAWDFEIGAGTSAVGGDDIDHILDETWKRGGPAAGGAPTL